MGWANCGTDSAGRPIGYAVAATCDHPDCENKIDRGLSFACGGMHGSDNSCEGYFCPEHLTFSLITDTQVCFQCDADLEADAAEEVQS